MLLSFILAFLVHTQESVKSYIDEKQSDKSVEEIQSSISNIQSYSDINLQKQFPIGYFIFYQSGKKIVKLKTMKVLGDDFKIEITDTTKFTITDNSITLTLSTVGMIQFHNCLLHWTKNNYDIERAIGIGDIDMVTTTTCDNLGKPLYIIGLRKKDYKAPIVIDNNMEAVIIENCNVDSINNLFFFQVYITYNGSGILFANRYEATINYNGIDTLLEASPITPKMKNSIFPSCPNLLIENKILTQSHPILGFLYFKLNDADKINLNKIKLVDINLVDNYLTKHKLKFTFGTLK